MFFDKMSDRIIIFNLFGKTTVNLNITIQADHDNIVQPVEETVESITESNTQPTTTVVKEESHNNCPICHNSPCTCEASGDGNFVM